MGGQTFPIARFDGLPPSRATTGQVETMALYAGQSVGDVHAIQPAAEIMAELVGGAVGLPLAAAGRAELASVPSW